MTVEYELLQLSLTMNNKTRDQKSPPKLHVPKADPTRGLNRKLPRSLEELGML